MFFLFVFSVAVDARRDVHIAVSLYLHSVCRRWTRRGVAHDGVRIKTIIVLLHSVCVGSLMFRVAVRRNSHGVDSLFWSCWSFHTASVLHDVMGWGGEVVHYQSHLFFTSSHE